MRPRGQAPTTARGIGEPPHWSAVLRALREARGVTQDGWAALLGVSRATVQRWERGDRAPDPETENEILEACREAGLFRHFNHAPLDGLSLTVETLRDLLTEGRLEGGAAGRYAARLPDEAAPGATETSAIEGRTAAAGNASTSGTAAGLRTSNLPASLTSFVGRQQEIALLRRVLGGTRLLTLTGVGGCGKTRLALELAGELLWAYPHGVWLAELAALADPSLVPQTVASALSLRPSGDRPVLDLLLEHLAARHLLLILDNCEHLLPASAGLAATLLRACPNLEILVTSREPLGVPGETIWRVPPLSLPDGGSRGQGTGDREIGPIPSFPTHVGREGRSALGPAPAQSSVLSPQSSESDAVQLFVERARQYQPQLALLPASEDAIRQICRRLDGIPLAIELAAARVSALSVEQIAARLADRFALLTAGNRTALPRQQTLRATLDWSYDLLAQPERAVLRRLAVFAGGFTLEAAEAVAGNRGQGTGNGEPAPSALCPLPSALDLLVSLVEKSLVQAEEQAGSVRYRLLETVGQYAFEKLDEAGEAASVRDRHLAWCLSLAHSAEEALGGSREPPALRQLEQEHRNLRAALRWSLDKGASGVEDALALAAALARFWELHGHLEEGRHWLTRALAAGEAAPAALRARAVQGAGILAYAAGDYEAARRLFTESLMIGRELGDREAIAEAQGNLGRTVLRQGDYPAARAFLEASLTLHTELGCNQGVANVQFTLGVVALRQGDYAAAHPRFEASLSINRALGNREGIANALEELAATLGEEGDDGRQAALLEESLALYRELGDRSGIASVLGHLGMGAWARDEYDQALTLLQEGIALYRAVGDRRGVARLLGNQSLVALYRGDSNGAETLCRESLALGREVGDAWLVCRYLPVLAGAAFAQGHPQRAACLFAAAARLRERHGAVLPPVVRLGHDRTVAALRATLGDEPFLAAWAAGHKLALDEVIREP